MARYMPPEQNGKHDPRKRRSQTDRPARYVSDAEYRSGRADYSRLGRRFRRLLAAARNAGAASSH